MSNRATFFRDLLAQHDLEQASLAQSPLPNTRDEAWRFTDLSPLATVAWQRPRPQSTAGDPPPNLGLDLSVGLSVVDGHVDTQALPPGLTMTQANPSLTGDEFLRLNTLVTPQPMQLQVQGVIETPLLVVYAGSPTLVHHHPHLQIDLADRAQLTLIELFIGSGVHWCNSVTHLHLAPSARLTHVRWQRQDRHSFHTGHTVVRQERQSTYHLAAVTTGSQLSRHTLQIDAQGEATHTDLRGLTWIQGSQLSDTHSALCFHHPHSTSQQMHKNVVHDQAHAVFHGRIQVLAAAQLTDARQSSRTLLLSPKARIDTQPQLEIQADNVKCAHGATVSELETDLLFYLQSRGIPLAQARAMLTQSFVADILDGIPLPEVKQAIAAELTLAPTFSERFPVSPVAGDPKAVE
ncbi:MAG: Fe-S cluster assembly protein SufD [Synechococcales cyanobacterium]